MGVASWRSWCCWRCGCSVEAVRKAVQRFSGGGLSRSPGYSHYRRRPRCWCLPLTRYLPHSILRSIIPHRKYPHFSNRWGIARRFLRSVTHRASSWSPHLRARPSPGGSDHDGRDSSSARLGRGFPPEYRIQRVSRNACLLARIAIWTGSSVGQQACRALPVGSVRSGRVTSRYAEMRLQTRQWRSRHPRPATSAGPKNISNTTIYTAMASDRFKDFWR